jgi:hypothetical protein
MLGPSMLMGRVAAKHIAAAIRHPLNPPLRKADAPALAGISSTETNTLGSWREVLSQLVDQHRPGYLHFEKAHAVVLARNYDCAKCHNESSPLALTEDQLDRRTMVSTCAFCHGGVKER